MFTEIYRYNTTSPSSARPNCSFCGAQCVYHDAVSDNSFDGLLVIGLVLVGFIGFILGTIITATIMSLTFNNNTAGRKNRTKGSPRRQQVHPIPPIDDEEEIDTDMVIQESEDAHKAHNTKINRLQIRASQSTKYYSLHWHRLANTRLNLRKEQLAIKMKRAAVLDRIALFKDLTTPNKSRVLHMMKLKTFSDGVSKTLS